MKRVNQDYSFYIKDIVDANTPDELLNVLRDVAHERLSLGVHMVNKLRGNISRKRALLAN